MSEAPVAVEKPTETTSSAPTGEESKIEVPAIASRMHKAYSDLMNDEVLIQHGVFGVSRMGPQDPSFLHSKDSHGGPPAPKDLDRFMKEIRATRHQAKQDGLHFGDGLIRLKDGNTLFWNGTIGGRSYAHSIRARASTEKAAIEGAEAIKANPDRPVVKQLENAKLFLKPIKFGSQKCVSCHPGTKVGDVAAISAVLLADKATPTKNPGAETVPLPKDIKAEFGLGPYPGAKPGQLHNRRINTTLYDVCEVSLETNDSVETVRKYYVDELRKKPSIAFGKPMAFTSPVLETNRTISYEFGDKHYGQISLRTSNGITSIQLVQYLAKDP